MLSEKSSLLVSRLEFHLSIVSIALRRKDHSGRIPADLCWAVCNHGNCFGLSHWNYRKTGLYPIFASHSDIYFGFYSNFGSTIYKKVGVGNYQDQKIFWLEIINIERCCFWKIWKPHKVVGENCRNIWSLISSSSSYYHYCKMVWPCWSQRSKENVLRGQWTNK